MVDTRRYTTALRFSPSLGAVVILAPWCRLWPGTTVIDPQMPRANPQLQQLFHEALSRRWCPDQGPGVLVPALVVNCADWLQSQSLTSGPRCRPPRALGGPGGADARDEVRKTISGVGAVPAFWRGHFC